jgi:SAM-dependent methyltransferase
VSRPSDLPVTRSATAWYDSPRYYDLVYADYTRPETRFLEAMLARHGPPASGPRRVLEPACGSGRLVESLARRGHRVWGFDLNRHQLAYARARLRRPGLRATLWQDDLAGFTLPTRCGGFDLAHCLVSTFKYLLRESEAVRHLRSVAAALRPGGLYVLGLHLTDYAHPAPDHERWKARQGRTTVVSDTWSAPADARTRTEAMRTRMRIREGGRSWETETTWDFRTYGPRQLRALLAKVPRLALVACHDFNYDASETRSLDLTSTDVVLVLRRVD